MKKITILLISLLIFHAQAQAYEAFCSPKLAKKTLGGNILSLSGFNAISRNAIENVLQKEIKKETNSKFKIKINNFYGNNILNGEFKSIKATSKKYAHDGIYLSNINIETICPYNHILFENDILYFRENMVLKFSANLTKEELEKTLESGNLNKNLASILKKLSKHKKFYSFANVLLPISIPIKIDSNTPAKLTIEKIDSKNKEIYFESYILINKNK